MKPLQMLLSELQTLKRCKEKSIISFNKGELDKNIHKIHLKNLTPLINEFETAIHILKERE